LKAAETDERKYAATVIHMPRQWWHPGSGEKLSGLRRLADGLQRRELG
jgi:hypothetical protein